MSSAIDFDFSAVRMQSSPWHTGAKSRLYADQVSTSRDDDREGFQAHAVAQDDQPYIPGETKFCGITFKQWGPDTGKWIECVSWGLSCTALVVTSGFWGNAYGNTNCSNDKRAFVRLNQEVLLFTNDTAMANAMHYMQTEYHEFCKSTDFKMDLQVPSMPKANVENFVAGKNSTMYAMSANVHAGTVSLFPIAFCIFLFSSVLQFARWYEYCVEEKNVDEANKGLIAKEAQKEPRERLYKPWLGPDFSRWMEYLFTSPFQIFIVVTAFGFANRDTVMGLCGMQAALVLFGYDIEQQIKKIYKREQNAASNDGSSLRNSRMQAPRARRFHNILWPYVRDIRGFVYLAVAWLLHWLIWSSIFMRFDTQDQHGKQCGGRGAEIPRVVLLIMFSQFGAFTLFGVANSIQFFYAVKNGKRDREDQKAAWMFYSICYGLLSITAKMFLAFGFIWYTTISTTWPLVERATAVYGSMSSGEHCWAVHQQKPVCS